MTVTFPQLISAIPLATRSDCLKFMLLTDDRMGHAMEYALCQHSASHNSEAHKDLINLVFAQVELGAERVSSLLRTFLQPRSGQPDVPGALAFLSTYIPEAFWEFCFTVCVSKLDKSNFHSLISQQLAATLVIHSVSSHIPTGSTDLAICRRLLSDRQNSAVGDHADSC